MRLSLAVLTLTALSLNPLARAQKQSSALSLQPQNSAAQAPAPAAAPKLPEMLWECDQNNCATLQGLWMFDDMQGQGMWNLESEPTTLTIKQFDGTHIVIDRVDPPDATGSRNLVGNGGSLRVEYTGTITGDRIEGTAVWDKVPNQPYPWAATIMKRPVCTDNSCPLDSVQRMKLGLRLFEAKSYLRAADLFVVDERTDPDAAALAAYSLALQGPVSRVGKTVFALAKQSAGDGSAVGMIVLGRFYKHGVGTPVDAALGAQWEQLGNQKLDARVDDERASNSTKTLFDMMDTFFPPPKPNPCVGHYRTDEACMHYMGY